MDMSQGELFKPGAYGNSNSDGSSDNDSKTLKDPVKNLEDFEKRALQDESQSIPVNSIPADNLLMMNMGGSSVRQKEFNLPYGSFAYPDK